jgi:hypothetical protein
VEAAGARAGSSAARLRGRLAFELLDPLQGTRLERGGLSSDRRFAGTLHLRHAPFERLDQLLQFTNRTGAHHHHVRRLLYRSFCERDTFQTSPHLVHRQ